jgi:endonuclease/exonuclease/phosphatase family metal-dependent hydrolase
MGTISSLKNYNHTYVLMGDFNSTWDHAGFRSLLGSKFVDSSEQAGEGFHMIYPANSKLPSVIEIDHIVHTSDVTVGDIQTIEIPGSDHHALMATLEAAS